MGGPSAAYSGAEGARLGSARRSDVKAQWSFVVAGALVTALSGSGLASRVDAGQTFGSAATSLSPDRVNELVQTRCAVCHTDAKPLGGLSLQPFDAARPDPAVARLMLVKVRDDGAMFAAGNPSPSKETIDAFVRGIAELSARPPADARWTVDMQPSPKGGHSVVVATRTVGAAQLRLACDGKTRRGHVAIEGAPGTAQGAPATLDFDGLSPTVRQIIAWCLAAPIPDEASAAK